MIGKPFLFSGAIAASFCVGAVDMDCMTLVVGKKVSATGHVLVGHNEDDRPPLSVRHGMVPRCDDWPDGCCLPASYGCSTSVPQVKRTFACYWSEVKFPHGDKNADSFLNENGVLVVSNSGGNSKERMDNPSLLSEGGVKFNLRRAVAERATSARDGVRVLCGLVEQFGYAPSARIYTVADKDEAWLVQVVHGRHYVAVRCPDDEVTIMPNLYTVYELDAFPKGDVIVSPGLIENAKRKGFWDGKGKFNFAKAYQASFNFGPEHSFEHPNNTGRFRQAIRLLTGQEWPDGKPFPFSVKPAKTPFGVDDMKAILSAHNGPLQNGKHVRESWSICAATTIESSVCEFQESAKANVLHVALGQGCEKPYLRLVPFSEPLPPEIDESATAVQRLAFHVYPTGESECGKLTYEKPAPGRTSGRIYYYVPEGIDLSRPVPLLIFLHGGNRRSPDDAPGNYFSSEKNWLMPDIIHAPFVVAAPSAPPAETGSRWNQPGAPAIIEATIEAAKKKFNVDPDRIFLGGHSMGGYAVYHHAQILADRFAGVWFSAGAWWEADFRSLWGTPVYIQHGALDCSTRPGYRGSHVTPRHHKWCGVEFGRGAHELMKRDGVDHVYDEHAEGHSLSFPGAKAALRRFFAWSLDKRRNPYATKIALVTPCGSKHPTVEPVKRTRWLELVEATEGEIAVDAIVLEGPDVAETDADLKLQTHSFTTGKWEHGARILAENLGGNKFRVKTENVKKFNLYLAPQMGDLAKPFTIEFDNGKSVTLVSKPVAGDRDFTAKLEVTLGE